MDAAALREIVKDHNVFARVAPEHKLGLVRALQDNGQVTAMTGDGVNDAPALKQSNIGVAMGITGTSVSKEAADIVLTDDNFASIAAAVEEGRRVYDNLIKSLAFVLPTNLGLALILIYAVAFFPLVEKTIDGQVVKDLLLPMLPTQLLWINLVAAVTLALPLAFEAKEPDVMNRPPRDPKEPVLNKFVVFRTLLAATLMTAGAVGLFLWRYEAEMAARVSTGLTEAQIVSEAQTMAVTTVIMFQVFYMLSCRSLKDSVFKIGFFSNKTVFIGIGAVLALQALFIYAPPMQAIFSTFPLTAQSLLVQRAGRRDHPAGDLGGEVDPQSKTRLSRSIGRALLVATCVRILLMTGVSWIGSRPSCGARRMAQTARNLVDCVIPHVPIPQWVLVWPIRIRLLAPQPTLLKPVL